MRTRWRLAVVVALLGAVLPLLQAPASAAAPDAAAPDPAVVAALQRIAADKHTKADIALIMKDRELAAKVADPDATKVEWSAPTPLARPDNAVNTEYCYGAEVRVTVKTVLGFDLFVWGHYAQFCISDNPAVVTRWLTRFDRMHYADPTVYVRDLMINSVTPTPAYSSQSNMQRHLEQCVIRYGCYANWYPWAWMRPRGDFALVWDGGAA